MLYIIMERERAGFRLVNGNSSDFHEVVTFKQNGQEFSPVLLTLYDAKAFIAMQKAVNNIDLSGFMPVPVTDERISSFAEADYLPFQFWLVFSDGRAPPSQKILVIPSKQLRSYDLTDCASLMGGTVEMLLQEQAKLDSLPLPEMERMIAEDVAALKAN